MRNLKLTTEQRRECHRERTEMRQTEKGVLQKSGKAATRAPTKETAEGVKREV